MKKTLIRDTHNFIQKLWFIIPIYLLLGWVLFLTAPNFAYWNDVAFWQSWARYIYQHGIGQIYRLYDPSLPYPFCNYHPIWLMMLDAVTELKGEWLLEGKHILVAKSWPLFFDVLGALGVFLLIKQREGKVIWLPLVALLNIAYLYNSWVWFQIDSIFTVFSLFALVFLIRGQVAIALVFSVLAINTKLQAIIFVPLIGLLILPFLIRRPLKVASGLFLALLCQAIILIPFWYAGTLQQLWQIVTGAAHTYPFVSMNAYNLWYLLIPEPMNISDVGLLVMGLTYKQVGFGLFLIFSTVTLLPLARRCWLWLCTNSMPKLADAPLVMLSASSVTLVFFFFNTQMHERYSHPAILFLFYYGALTRRWWLYVLFSFAYLSNMYMVLPFFEGTPIVMLSASSVALVFFFFYTEMHKLYSHRTTLSLLYYGVLLIFGLFFFAYLINMYMALDFFEGTPRTNREFIEYFKSLNKTHPGLGLYLRKLTAVLFMLVLGLNLWELYTRHWHYTRSN